MRFKRWPRVTPYRETSRKRAAFHRSQRDQRNKLPLLADLIGEAQPTVEEEMARRAQAWLSAQQRRRDERAALWRRARARLIVHGDKVRPILRKLWNEAPYPADPYSLLDFLTQYERGLVDFDRPPWTPQALKPRITPNPARFDEAFRQIGQRGVGGGPKSTGADELLFCGNLGRGLIYLTTQPRLHEPRESFYTSSSHRLRDSKVGDGGHWIDVVVTGECSDDDLETIRRLAQAADTREVRVRRRTVNRISHEDGP